MAGFGLLWALTGAGAFRGAAALAVVAGAVLVTAATATSAVRPKHSTRSEPGGIPPDWARRFSWIGAVQGLAIAATVTVLVRSELAEAVPVAVCVIVALHFVPLARLFAQPRFIATAVALCAVAAAGGAMLVLTGAQTAQGTTGLGAAAVLWITVLASRWE